MKNIIFTILALIIILAISCQKENIKNDNNSANAIKITAQTVTDNSLRTAFINPSVNWIAGVDHIGLYSNRAYTDEPGNYASNVDYTAVSTGTISTFTSTTPVYWDGTNNEHDFGAYYPYVAGTFPFTAVPICLPSSQTQDGATTDHIGPLDFEVATPIGIFPGTGEGGTNPTVGFNFNHVFTILKFDITCSNAHTLTQISVTKDVAPNISLNTGSTIDISTYPTPALYTITEASGGTPLNVTLTLSPTLPISSTIASAYMLILPGNHTGTGNFTIDFKNENNTTYTLHKDGINFERGKVYTVTVDIPVGAGGWE